MPGREDGAEPKPPDGDDRVVLEDGVVGRQHGGVGGRDAHVVAGVTQLGDRLDVVPVAVGLEDTADAEGLAQLEQLLVFVGGVDEHRVACVLASDDVDVVVHRSDHGLVDLDLVVLVVHAASSGRLSDGCVSSLVVAGRLQTKVPAVPWARRGRQL